MEICGLLEQKDKFKKIGDNKLKTLKIVLFAVALVCFSAQTFSQTNDAEIMSKFSLFYEYQRNNDMLSAYPYGLEVINADPSKFIKFGIFRKMDIILFALHDSTDTSADDKVKYEKDAMTIYDNAIKYEPEKAGYYTARKAYVMEVWLNKPISDVFTVYEEAIALDENVDPYYQDRLGQMYKELALDNSSYKVFGLQLYQKLQEKYPDEQRWALRMAEFADGLEDLARIMFELWEKDKENDTNAWSSANTSMRANLYDLAKQPLESLTKKHPEVVNYWVQLGLVYSKLDERDNAIEAYKQLIKLEPSNKDAYINIALVYKKMNQLSVSRSYLQKASSVSENWDYPIFIEAQLYEQAISNCSSGQVSFEDKVAYKLAYDTYLKAARMGGQHSGSASERAGSLKNACPTQEDYFFRNYKSGNEIAVNGKCYDWIGKKIVVP